MLHLIVFLQEHAAARFVIKKKGKLKIIIKRGAGEGPVQFTRMSGRTYAAWRGASAFAACLLRLFCPIKLKKRPHFFLNGFAASSSKRRDNNINLLELRKFRFTGTLEKKIPQWLLLFLQFRFQMNNGENGTKLDWSQRATS